jgi:tetrahydromethanopterin S-methyltransferase subunit B
LTVIFQKPHLTAGAEPLIRDAKTFRTSIFKQVVDSIEQPETGQTIVSDNNTSDTKEDTGSGTLTVWVIRGVIWVIVYGFFLGILLLLLLRTTIGVAVPNVSNIVENNNSKASTAKSELLLQLQSTSKPVGSSNLDILADSPAESVDLSYPSSLNFKVPTISKALTALSSPISTSRKYTTFSSLNSPSNALNSFDFPVPTNIPSKIGTLSADEIGIMVDITMKVAWASAVLIFLYWFLRSLAWSKGWNLFGASNMNKKWYMRDDLWAMLPIVAVFTTIASAAIK